MILPRDKAQHVSHCLELAVLLEASAHKPGNVSVVTNFEHTRYEHFLASAVAATPSFEYAASRGMAVADGRLGTAEIGVGSMVKNCVAYIDRWQHGGNTLLGAVMLLAPLGVAAGMTPRSQESFHVPALRMNLKRVIESTTPQDAVDVYEAIRIAKPSGLGKVPRLDVTNPNAEEQILKEQTSLLEVFRIAEPYDLICSEWVNNYPVTFDFAYPRLMKRLQSGGFNGSVIETFLLVLSEYPDTFIARKAGLNKAREVSLRAEQVLSSGLDTAEGRKRLVAFDNWLRASSNLLNPGTTADVMAAALALCVLGGYRP
jgi:triphosphoribosyl-dephospho-CoA synthase